MVSCQAIQKLLCKMVKINVKCCFSSLINLSSSAMLFGEWPGTDLASTLFRQMLKNEYVVYSMRIQKLLNLHILHDTYLRGGMYYY